MGPSAGRARALAPATATAWLLLATLATSAEARGGAGRWPVVRGCTTQPDLQLDLGRQLTGRRAAGWLQPIEKARLDARRVGRSSLPFSKKLERWIAIVRKRLPVDPTEQRYVALNQKQRTRPGYARLSEHVAKRAGTCRERAFLLRALLREAGQPARVVYGSIYLMDRHGEILEGRDHAWVELGGRARRLLDPDDPIAPIRRVKERVPFTQPIAGRSAVRRGVAAKVPLLPGSAGIDEDARRRLGTLSVLYTPTNDLHYLPRGL